MARAQRGDLKPLADLAKRAPAGARRPLKGLKYALPVARPGKIICLGLNYLAHVKEGRYANDPPPNSPPSSCAARPRSFAHESPIIRPSASESLDYEAEMVVVIGRGGKHIMKETPTRNRRLLGVQRGLDPRIPAPHHAVGHGQEFRPLRRLRALGGDRRRAAGGGKGLKIETRLNGTVMQSDNTDNMMFPVAETIAYVTQGMTLEPGDLIVTGTPSGVGGARKPPVWMHHGDTCEVEIQGIGILCNPIEDEKAA